MPWMIAGAIAFLAIASWAIYRLAVWAEYKSLLKEYYAQAPFGAVELRKERDMHIKLHYDGLRLGLARETPASEQQFDAELDEYSQRIVKAEAVRVKINKLGYQPPSD